MIRNPIVADRFYPGKPEALTRELKTLVEPVDKKGKKEPALGIVAPHAGYVYSGRVAGLVYSRIQIPPIAVIIGPNHTGQGSPASLFAEGEWRMPLGPVRIDRELARKILSHSRLLTPDPRAHQQEHSLEVQVPFLQHFNPGIAIVPICLGGLDYPECREIGQALARALEGLEPRPLIIASSDMTHYESQKSAEKKDKAAIDKILKLDPEGLLTVVEKDDISMCGVIPTAVMLIAALALGAKKAELVAYATSGDVSGDYAKVVGYAGITVT